MFFKPNAQECIAQGLRDAMWERDRISQSCARRRKSTAITPWSSSFLTLFYT